jgi:subtilisin family serine protease
MASGSKVWSVFGLVSTVGAGIAARKALTAVWKMSTGKEPPSNPEHPDTEMGEALAWAVFSGIVVALARLLAQRKAAAYYRKSTGRLPGNLEEIDV